MNHFQKVKELLLDLEHDITREDKDTGILVVNNESRGICDMILDCEDDVLILEQIIFPVRQDNANSYKKLLQMNRSLVHGAFVLTTSQGQDMITYRDTLQLEHLDRNELQESMNSLTYALVENMDDLLEIAGHAALV